MRLSFQRHTLSVLRVLVGLTQKEMAGILECSTPTIQAIELGKLKMSDKLAELTSIKTGISLAWLLNNDVSKPPIDITDGNYTKKTFEKYQAQSAFQHDTFGGAISNAFCHVSNIGRLEALILRAFTDDKMPLCAYKLSQAFDKLENEFNVTIEDHIAVNSLLGKSDDDFKNFDLNKAIINRYKRLKKGESENFTRSAFHEAIGMQEKKKDLRKQKKPHSYTISAGGQVRPVLSKKKLKHL